MLRNPAEQIEASGEERENEKTDYEQKLEEDWNSGLQNNRIDLPKIQNKHESNEQEMHLIESGRPKSKQVASLLPFFALIHSLENATEGQTNRGHESPTSC